MIFYISQSRIASPSANSIHVVNMYAALAELNKDEVLLFYLKGDTVSLKDYYGVAANLKGGYGRFLYLVLGLFLKLVVCRPKLIYSRSIYGSIFCNLMGQKVLHEHHTVKTGLEGFLQKILIWNKVNKHAVITHSLANDLGCTDYLFLPDSAQKIIYDTKVIEGTIGYIGSDKPGKGMDLIEKVSSLLGGYRFIIAGNSSPKRSTDNLKYFGHVLPSRVNTILGTCEVVILPNYGRSSQNINNYTSPLKLFEYMSAKKIIILSDLEVFREILSDDDAYFFEPGSVEDLAATISIVFSDLSEAERRANNAYQKFIENYTWSIRANRLLQYAAD